MMIKGLASPKTAVACTYICGKRTLVITLGLFSILELNRSQIKGPGIMAC